jgi:two-component system cell cycle sensor histidine kinase/response regulator CckA
MEPLPVIQDHLAHAGAKPKVGHSEKEAIITATTAPSGAFPVRSIARTGPLPALNPAPVFRYTFWGVALGGWIAFGSIACGLAWYADSAGAHTVLPVPTICLLFGCTLALLALAWAALTLGRQGAALRQQEEAAQDLHRQAEQLGRQYTEAEQGRQDTETNLRFLLGGMHGYAFFTLDSEGRALTWNNAAQALYACRAAEVVGQHYSCLFSGADTEKHLPEQQLKHAADHGRFEERGWRVRRDGSRFWAHVVITAVREPGGRLHRWLVMTRDITDQREAEEALRRSRVQYRNLTDAARDIVITVAPAGSILSLNPAFESVTGRMRGEWVGQPFTALVAEEDQPLAKEMLQRLAQGLTPPVFELRLLARPGKTVAVEFTASPQQERGQVTGWLGIGRNVSERKQTEENLRRTEERLRQAQKMEAIGQLAGGVAHDFNNLLTVIQGYCDILLHSFPGAGPANEPILEIIKASERAASLTRQLLAFSRKQVLQPEVLDLNTRLADTATMLRRLIGEDIELVTELDPAICLVKVDSGQMEQVLMNLVVNARDAMPKGGRLVISTARTNLEKAEGSSRPDVEPGPYVLLTVSDTGCGMDQATLAHIFEPFFTTKEPGKGTGLGLATVYGIVKQSGGHIEVASTRQKGTTFRIYLPQPMEAAPSPTLTAAPEKVSGGGETLLLVEDEEALRALNRLTLTSRGYVVLEARDGQEGLEVFERHQETIDMVVTDVVMPRLCGTGMVEQLRSRKRDLTVLFVSGYNDSTLFRRGAHPISNYLRKPFSSEELARSVRETLDAAGGS